MEWPKNGVLGLNPENLGPQTNLRFFPSPNLKIVTNPLKEFFEEFWRKNKFHLGVFGN